MTDHIRVQEVLAELGKMERELLRRYHIRLRVDKVTSDGRSALCSAAQVRRRFLRTDHTSYEVVDTCHEALIPLQRIGISPLIGWLPRERSNEFMKIDPKDPFRIRWALSVMGAPQVPLPVAPYKVSARQLEHQY
jgi:hypothetical protein